MPPEAGLETAVALWSDDLDTCEPPELPARYSLRDLVARGGMGEVWRVYDGDLRRTLALKVLRPERVAGTANARFLEEARATRVEHLGGVEGQGGRGKQRNREGEGEAFRAALETRFRNRV